MTLFPTRRLALALLACAALAPLSASAEAARFEQSAFDAALQSGAPMLVEVSAPWCPTCRAQKAVLADLLPDARYAGLVHLDVDFDSQKDVVRALDARQQSTLIVYTGGKEVGRVVGETDPEAIAALVGAAF